MKAYISATPLFKAYDEKTKEIRDVVCIDYINETVDLDDGHIERPFSEIALMQYTEVDDLNSEKIYAGSIVKVYGRFEIKTGVVRFTRGGFHVVFDESYMYKVDEFHCEVIGNIYQNPELLY